MNVLVDRQALLCNYEVLSHLQSNITNRQQQQANSSATTERRSSLPGKNKNEASNTIEFEVLAELSRCRAGMQNAELISKVNDLLTSIPSLTKAERLQIINYFPLKSILELHLIIEECEERFTQDQLQSLFDQLCEINK